MKLHLICWVFLVEVGLLSAGAQQTQQEPQGLQSSPSPAAGARQPSPEMQKLFKAFLGAWRVTEKIESSETMPNGGVGEGEEVYRAGPGGVSIIEEIHLKQTTGEISGLGVGWWDQQAQGYRAVWCDSENPSGCVLMAHLAKWEADQFVLRDEFERNGKKFDFKEVFSEIRRLPLRKLSIKVKRAKN